MTEENSDIEVSEMPKVIEDKDRKVYNYITELGFDEGNIEEWAEVYVVEGDIAFPKDMEVPSGGKSGETLHRYSGTFVNVPRQSDIRVRIDPSMNVQTAEIDAAIALWNNAGSNIKFRKLAATSSETTDILIRNVNLGPGVCGLAGFAQFGNPFPDVQINIAAVSGDNFNQRAINIAHELGHCIGLWHTNQTGSTVQNGVTLNSVVVPGYTTTDAASIMNGQQCHQLSTSLSAKDKGAVKALYQNPKPQNTQIQITSTQFKVTWSPMPTILSDSFTGFEITYSGFSGINFGNNGVLLSPSTTSYTIPGVTPYPTQNGSTGGIQVTVKARFSSGAVVNGPTVTRNKVNGVWQ